MQIGSAVYNHLSMELSPKKRNTTHKSSALKEVYTNMARYNKQSPLFMFSLSDTKQALFPCRMCPKVFRMPQVPFIPKKSFLAKTKTLYPAVSVLTSKQSFRVSFSSGLILLQPNRAMSETMYLPNTPIFFRVFTDST